MKLDSEVTFTDQNGVVACKAIARSYVAFDEYACFLGYYVDTEFAAAEKLQILVEKSEDSLRLTRDGIGAHLSHPVYDPAGTSSDNLPFTGRVIMYVNAMLEDAVRQTLVTLASGLGLHLQIRDQRYEERVSSTETPLGFISHDSRDKADFVEPLAAKLRSALCPIWYDEYSLKPGDSLRQSIDAGLGGSKRCVVVLSPNFIENPGWTKAEFNAAVNRHFSSGGNILIPIWHGVTAQQVRDYSPLVADIVAINSNLGSDEVFSRLHRALLAT